MKKASPTTYKVGTIGAFAAWTKRVVRDPRSARGMPKKWFDSEATAQRAAVEQMSAEAMVKLLSPGNLAVLDAIAATIPLPCGNWHRLPAARRPAYRGP